MIRTQDRLPFLFLHSSFIEGKFLYWTFNVHDEGKYRVNNLKSVRLYKTTKFFLTLYIRMGRFRFQNFKIKIVFLLSLVPYLQFIETVSQTGLYVQVIEKTTLKERNNKMIWIHPFRTHKILNLHKQPSTTFIFSQIYVSKITNIGVMKGVSFSQRRNIKTKDRTLDWDCPWVMHR